MPAHAARAPHCGRSGAGFGSILRVEVIEIYQGLVRPFQRLGKPTSFVVANFTRAQLRHLPTDDRHMGRGKSVTWLTHAWRRGS